MTVHRIRHDPVAIGADDHLGRALRDLAWSADNGAELRLNPVMAKALCDELGSLKVSKRLALESAIEKLEKSDEAQTKLEEEVSRLKAMLLRESFGGPDEPVAGDD